MKVKLVRRRIGESYPIIEVYDIYIGVPRILLPFLTRWFLDSKGLSEKEANARIWNSFLSVKGTKLITTVE
jgi:hypothetical protein